MELTPPTGRHHPLRARPAAIAAVGRLVLIAVSVLLVATNAIAAGR